MIFNKIIECYGKFILKIGFQSVGNKVLYPRPEADICLCGHSPSKQLGWELQVGNVVEAHTRADHRK